MEKTYQVNTLCENCGCRNKYEIKYGFSISWVECAKCGNYKLRWDGEDNKDVLSTQINKGKLIK